MTPMPQELEPLLQPISTEHPSGRNLRYEPLYDQVREARREDDATLSQGDWQTPLKLANWGRVVELSQPALKSESKDLQLASWLTEAWLFQGGLEGLARGLQLLTALMERFWDTLWPELNPEDTDARLAPLKWLDDRMPIALGRTPIVWPPAPGALSFGDWQLILRREKQGGARAEEPPAPAAQPAVNAPPQTREAFLLAGARLSTEALALSREQLERVLAEATALEQILTARLEQPTVVLHRTRSGLEEFQSLLTLLSSKRASAPGAVTPGPGGVPTNGASPSAPASLAGGIHSRAEAYQFLSVAADYLMGTEPHSPVPYLVRRALAWGDMPLGKLMGELVPDSSGLAAIHTLLGMKPQE